MERREFLAAGAAVIADRRLRIAECGIPPAQSAVRNPQSAQEPSLGPAVFARRLERLQAELKTRELHLLVAEPGTNYEYFTGHNPGRSERLILLLAPATGRPVIVCPAFEVERIRRDGVIQDVRGWEEDQDPWRLVRQVGVALKPPRRNAVAALEPSTSYDTYARLDESLHGWGFVNGAPVTERLRIVKDAEEVALIRRAIAITEAAIAATFERLAPGLTERDVARRLSGEMQDRGAPGGGLVQFGPSSAVPHGGPGGGRLERETVVLIDAGCRVEGYLSDVTRTIWFGDSPSDEFKRVFNLVHDAQTAAMELGRPLFTQCQQMDRAARKVIADGGYGPAFTHRLGHGLGMDGHEVPYLVEGNETRLEPGMVFTIEPGIYQLGKFGVRIEDDCLMTESGVEVLSHRVTKV